MNMLVCTRGYVLIAGIHTAMIVSHQLSFSKVNRIERLQRGILSQPSIFCASRAKINISNEMHAKEGIIEKYTDISPDVQDVTIQNKRSTLIE